MSAVSVSLFNQRLPDRLRTRLSICLSGEFVSGLETEKLMVVITGGGLSNEEVGSFI